MNRLLDAASTGETKSRRNRTYFLLLQRVVDCGVQLQLLRALHGFQAYHYVVDDLVKPAQLRAKRRAGEIRQAMTGT